ncbi:Hachiman antiphage defense system protein HamA [Bacillus alveayuensis]|uniref:Hachiman antiphage defense system protein HamA n=1 Tax=Aeribacillus alveayuensis TaxID=279215 RepID=UPI0005D106B2|nr:Hachiman antiphage defense system protein HamA [Bacillus alveayuensis]
MKLVSTTEYLRWLVDTGQKLTLNDGKNVDVWKLNHENDDAVLSAWAKHFRNHYCLDSEIDFFRRGFNFSRAEYLNKIKFPDRSIPPGPSIRAGDFSEILVADYLQYILNFWVPRTRYADKNIRNESSKGSDVIGFKIFSKEQDSLDDTLAIYEVKAKFTGRVNNRLQDAVDHSSKDYIRIAESLNAIKQRLFLKGERDEAISVERFQNSEDRPYKEIYGAVAVLSTELYDPIKESQTVASNHRNPDKLTLLVIHGRDMMDLVHELYRRAADEA